MLPPFLGKIADETKRRSAKGGRVETTFDDYNESNMFKL